MENLHTVKELIELFPEGEWAIPAFNVFNMEFVQGVLMAADEQRSPVILSLGDAILSFSGVDMLIDICHSAIKTVKIPVAIALDHGKITSHLNACLDRGVSIMFDASDFSLSKNIKETSYWSQRAKQANVSIEAELGSFGAEFTEGALQAPEMTTPEDCAKFIANVDVDLLAVGIGNYHGKYKSDPAIDVQRLSEIRSVVNGTPLVLHGASGIPRDTVARCIQNGVKKVNYGYDLKYANAVAIREVLNQDPMPFQPPVYLKPGRDAIFQAAKERIIDVNSQGLVDRA